MNCVYSYMRDGSVYVNRMLKPITGYNGTWVTDSSTGSGGDFTMSFPTIAPAITITKSGSTYTATRVSDNSTVSSGTNAATVIQAALNGLTSGRTAKQKVYLNDSATISTMITMPSYSVLECADGVIITGGASNRIIGCTSAAHDIEIIGGEWVCGSTTASQTVAPMYFNTPTDLIVRSCKVRDCMYDNIIVTNGNHCTFYDVESFHSWPLDPMDIAANGWHGIIFQTTNGHNASYNTVQKCYFHDNGHGGCYFYTEPGWTSEISHNEMRGNRVEMCGTSGLSISQRSSAGQGHYNIIEYNFLKDCGLDNDHPFINIGYSSCYPDTTTHNIVRYNTLIDNNLAGPKSAEYGQYGADQGIICQGSSTEIYKNDIKGATGGITLLCGTGIDCHDNYIHEVASQGVNALYNSAIVIFSAVGSSSIKDNDVYDVDNVFCYYTSSCGAGPGSNTISGNNDLANPLTTFDGGYASGSSTSGGGFPMEVVDDADMDSHICRLSGDKFIVFYGKAGATVKARMFNGTTLGGEETCSLGPLASATAISTAHDNSDQVWMLYTKNTGTDYRIMYRHRSSGGSWDAEEQDVVGSAVYSSSVGWIGLGYDNQLYAMWFNYPNTNHIYYRPITKAGVMGDIVDAYTDADGIASVSRANLMPVARPTSSTTAAMGLAYIAGSSPYKVKLFKLNFNSGTTAVVEDPVEPETEGSAPITDYDYICYSDGRAGVKNGTLTDRGSARQGIQWCIDNCPAGGNILLSPGTYNIDGQITVKNNNIYGSVNYSTQTIWNGTTLQMESTPNVAVPACRLLATWNDGSGGSGTGVGYIFRRDSGYTEPITIGYLELDGGMDYNAANSRAVYGGIGLYRSTNTTVTNCYIHNFCKAGVYIADTTTQTGSTYNGRIQNCEIAYIGMRWTSGATRWWGNGIAWGGGGYSTGASRNYVSNCYIHDCTMHAADFEPGKNSTIINCRMDCSTSYTDTGSNTKAPWTVGYLAWGGRSSTGNLLSHCLIRSETGWTVVYNGSTTTGNTATNNTCQYHSGGAGFVASGDASLGNQTFSGNTETAI